MSNRKQVLINLKEALEKVCENCCCDFEECKCDGFCVDYTNIEQLPTVDAVEVVHAMWNFDAEWWEYVCSNCRRAIGNTKTYPYCPNCGAKMDGDKHG